jgi:hypothetical protein
MGSDAIIFIPGIKGSKLVETNRATHDTIWSGIQSNFESIEDLELTHQLKDQYYDEPRESIVKAGEVETLAYGEFLRDLKTDKPVYIFSYDWRLSAKQNGSRLRDFVEYLIEKSKISGLRKKDQKNIQKFDFITHSLGNAVLRSYIQQFDLNFRRINKIVFTVPPFLGSIDIVVGILIGEGFFPNVKAKIRKLIRTFPGALELLPKYKASRFDSQKKHDFFKFIDWQKNVISPKNLTSEKFKAALSVAHKTIENNLCDLSKLSKDKRDRILVIARHGYKTYQSLVVYKKQAKNPDNYFDLENACRNDHGDGRVPHVSSCHYFDSVSTLMVDDAFFYKDYSHGFVLKDERVQKLVNRFLSSSTSKFKYNIPGGSVKKVIGLIPDQKTDPTSWSAKTK